MGKRFVIVVDAQQDFMMPDGALYVPGAQSLIGPMNAWLKALDPGETAGVLLTFDTHYVETYAASAEAAQFPLHCVRNSPGWQSVIDVDAIAAAIPLYTLEKGVFAMWEEPDVVIRDARHPERPATPRDRFFDELRQGGIGEVTVIGVAADFCVRWAVEGLIGRGFRVVVPATMTSGIVRQITDVAAEEWTGRDVEIA